MAFSHKTVATLWLILLTLFLPLPTRANGQARLYLQNVPLQDERLLVVTVQLADVADLYGADLEFRFDPTRLRVRDENLRLAGIQIAPGPLLASDDRFVVKNMADEQAGIINFVFTLLNPTPPINGEGVLTTITFEIVESGPFSVEVVKAQLASPQAESLPVVTENLYLNDDLQPTPAPELVSSDRPVWVITALLGLLLVLGFLLTLRPKWATAPTKIHLSPHKISGATQSSIRSSILLTEQGRRVLRQDDLGQAYELFSRAIELDPANSEAWLGKGLVAQQETEKRICFERVLALEPDNVTARQELQDLNINIKPSP